MRLSLGPRRDSIQLAVGRGPRTPVVATSSPERDHVVAAAETVTLVLGKDSPLPESAAGVEDLVRLLRGHIAQLGSRTAPGTSALARAAAQLRRYPRRLRAGPRVSGQARHGNPGADGLRGARQSWTDQRRARPAMAQAVSQCAPGSCLRPRSGLPGLRRSGAANMTVTGDIVPGSWCQPRPPSDQSPEPGGSSPAGKPAVACADELIAMATRDRQLTREAVDLPGSASRRLALMRCRAKQAEQLGSLVVESGWPSCAAVGEDASLAALQILLHSRDAVLMDLCQQLLTMAVDERHSPAIHLAYVTDAGAVLRNAPQVYGTAIDPALLRPYPIADPEGVEERRRSVGLPPLRDELDRCLAMLRNTP